MGGVSKKKGSRTVKKKNRVASVAEVDDSLRAEKNVEPTAEVSSAEIQRRRRAVRASKVLFRTIDLLFNLPQNNCPYVTKGDIGRIEFIGDVVYDKTLADTCRLDIYRVRSDAPQPAVILIHGGGFTAGDKKYRRGQAQYFALKGFTVFCVNYGLSPDFVFPDPYRHVVNAANFVYDSAAEYNILADKIVVAGDSAGAYYASMLAANSCTDAFANEFGVELSFKICGALLNCGIYDIDTILKTKYFLDLDDGVFLSLTGFRRGELDSYKYRHVCTPLGFIDSRFPPSFVIYSDHDLFCRGQSNILLERMNDCSVYCEHYSARHAPSNHCFSLNWRGEDATAANELMMSFAKRLVGDRIKL